MAEIANEFEILKLNYSGLIGLEYRFFFTDYGIGVIVLYQMKWMRVDKLVV